MCKLWELTVDITAFIVMCKFWELTVDITADGMCAKRIKIMYFLIFCFQSFVQFSPDLSAAVNPVV